MIKVYITIEDEKNAIKFEKVVNVLDGYPFPNFTNIVSDMVDMLPNNKEPDDFSGSE